MKVVRLIRRNYMFVQMNFLIVLIIQLQVFSLVPANNVDFTTDLNNLQVAANRVKRAQRSRSKCFQPSTTPDRNYNVKLSLEEETTDANPGQTVPENAIIVSRCNKGYALDYDYEESYELLSICKNNSWQPPILKCKRMCKNFSNFSNSNMTCYQYFGGPKIPCTGLMLEGAIVKPRCRKKFHPDVNVDYDYATCRRNGTWDKEFFKCIPECGEVASASVSLISNGIREKRGGAPWNVVIYSVEKSETPELICGGTLISADLVISAAHCFYDEVFHQNQDIEFFYVIVGKATPDFEKQDYPTTKTYRLRNIYFPDDITFEGANTNYAGDIAILQLSEKVTFSQDVFPACLHWDERDRFHPNENIMGKLSGFGEKADGKFPSELLTAILPYISYGECKKKVRNDFRTSISTDKFCAGSEKGTGARRGDSGGGLLFIDNETELYHLRGIVSNKDLSEKSNIATFTDVTQYMSWILKIVKVIEDESKLCGCNPSGSSSNSCDSKTGTCECKAFVIGKKCNICKVGYWRLQADNPDGCVACGCSSMGAHSSSCDQIDGSCQCKPNIIGRQCNKCADKNQVLRSNGCEEHSGDGENSESLNGGDNSDSEHVPCGAVSIANPLVIHDRGTYHGQWPWHVAIYRIVGNNLNYLCAGSLVSKNKVLTAAHCLVYRRPGGKIISHKTLVVYVGKYNLTQYSGESTVQVKKVNRLNVNPAYNGSNYHGDIAIMTLSSDVEFTNYVRPICLWESTNSSSDVVGQKGFVSGWGVMSVHQATEQLQMATHFVVSTEQCLRSYPKFYSEYLGETAFCAGSRNGTTSCNGDSGGSLAFKRDEGTWYLRGIVSLSVAMENVNSCDPNYYVIYTDTARYVDFIRKNMY